MACKESKLAVPVGSGYEELAMNALEAAAINARMIAVDSYGLAQYLENALDRPAGETDKEVVCDRINKMTRKNDRLREAACSFVTYSNELSNGREGADADEDEDE